MLPSIHAESCLLVPDPGLVKWPAHTSAPASVLLAGHAPSPDTEADPSCAADQLTELRGSLFLSDEYGQAYFQPWN